LGSRGSFKYSSLGSAAAGQAVAAAAGMSYSDLMRTRLFEPLGMSHTTIQDADALVTGGKSQTGITVQPWTFDAYAPAGAPSPRPLT
jgi:CubicO group peptidase (beta-lactamase class C family)